MAKSTLITLIESFPRLRALDLHKLNIKIMPNSIGKLIHLKYLDLSFNPIKTLPDSITALLNLQTLKLQERHNLEQLPRDITKLVRAFCDDQIKKMMLGIQVLISMPFNFSKSV